MKKSMAFAVAVVLSLGFSPVMTSMAAMGYGGGGGGSSGGGSGGGYGGGGSYNAGQSVKHCKKGEVLNKATHTCVRTSHRAHKAYRPSGIY